MHMHCSCSLGLTVVFLFVFDAALAQQTVVIRFDNTGEESGITRRGTNEFSFMGSNWTGGVVDSERITPLYASGSFSYELGPGGGGVTFDTPVDSVEFFFVHGFGFAGGTATAFNANGNSIASGTSNQATFFGDRNNFLSLDPEEPIVRIGFTGGVIDNFSFTPLPDLPAATQFIRGDANSDGVVNITDGVFVLNFLFLGRTTPPCREASDANADGDVNITDGVFLLNFLFAGGPEPPAPFGECGTDPTRSPAEVDCASFAACGTS